MSGVFQNIDLPPSSPPGEWASVYPPPPLAFGAGEDTLTRGRGGGGQYFGRRQTQLCTLHV